MPTTPNWCGTGVDYDSLYEALKDIKAQVWPRHTARDDRDPINQLLQLGAALGDFAFGRVNVGFKRLDPNKITSRNALLVLMSIMNKALNAARPSGGYLVAQYTGTLTAGAELVPNTVTIAKVGPRDPIFLIDEAFVAGSSVELAVWFYDGTPDTQTTLAAPYTSTIAVGDGFVFTLEALAFVDLPLALTSLADQAVVWSIEHTNEEWGTPSQVIDQSSELRFNLNAYLSTTTTVAGLRITIRLKATGDTEAVTVEWDGTHNYAVTGLFAQVDPSLFVADYEVFA